MTVVSRELRGLAAMLVGAALALGACGGAGENARRTDMDAGSSLTLGLRLDALDGGEIDLARYRGRVVVLHLFDTDSPAAALDAEKLTRLASDRRDRATVVGICLDREGYPMAAAWRRALRVRYLIALADQQLRDGKTPLGRVRVVPTTYLLDRTGHLAHRIEGPLRPGEVERLVDDLLD